ncbi:MAG: TIGR02281 family clan AA aspartic protease [Pseudomonadota bacterium]
MGRFFWIIMGLVGALLILLIVTGDTGKTLGFETNQFAGAAIMALWAAVVGSAVLGRGTSFANTAAQLAIWGVIILGLMAGYVYRFDLQDFGARMSGGIIPGSPISRQGDDGRTSVTLVRSNSGHFEAVAGVNEATVRFLVDTGATVIVLSADDARTVGIEPSTLNYTVLTRTANGTGRSARARIDRLYLGGIERRNLSVLVAEPGRLSQSLLGQQFLETLSSYERRGDRLTLRD